MDIDVDSVDHALSTTRAVRRRLDLEREVDEQIILDCIDVAEQAPTGGNLSSRRWLLIRDPQTKQALADIYQRGAGQRMITAAERLVGSGHPQERNMASSAYLVEHLAEVPAIVVPLVLGRHDGSGRPGLFDSVIQAGWSFCVALRARGLGTAWVTAIFNEQDAIKRLLGIPDHLTEIAMFPVAWTKGTDFAPAPRRPARTITYFDTYARTFESGPSNPVRFTDGPGTIAEIDIDAPASDIWPVITDINLSAAYSPEFQGAEWVDPDQPVGVGSSFIGRNRNDHVGEFSLPSFIDAWEENVAFGWRTSDMDNPGARWRFELEPTGTSTRLRYSMILGPGPSNLTTAIEAMPDIEDRIVNGRVRAQRTSMLQVIAGVKRTVEARR